MKNLVLVCIPVAIMIILLFWLYDVDNVSFVIAPTMMIAVISFWLIELNTRVNRLEEQLRSIELKSRELQKKKTKKSSH